MELPVPELAALELPLELPCPGAEELAGVLEAELSVEGVAGELEAGVVLLAGVLGVLPAGVAG